MDSSDENEQMRDLASLKKQDMILTSQGINLSAKIDELKKQNQELDSNVTQLLKKTAQLNYALAQEKRRMATRKGDIKRLQGLIRNSAGFFSHNQVANFKSMLENLQKQQKEAVRIYQETKAQLRTQVRLDAVELPRDESLVTLHTSPLIKDKQDLLQNNFDSSTNNFEINVDTSKEKKDESQEKRDLGELFDDEKSLGATQSNIIKSKEAIAADEESLAKSAQLEQSATALLHK